MHGGGDELPRYPYLHEHVGAGVLNSLERADWPPKLFPYSDVADRRVQHRLAQPETVAGDRDGGRVEQRADRSIGITVEPPHRIGAHFNVLRSHSTEPARAVQDRLGRPNQASDPRRDSDDHRHAARVVRQQQQPISLEHVRHEPGAAGQPQPARCALPASLTSAVRASFGLWSSSAITATGPAL